ncbi:MAG: hypothetical protein ACM3ZE_09880, partial [Myxococcales bacterium]
MEAPAALFGLLLRQAFELVAMRGRKTAGPIESQSSAQRTEVGTDLWTLPPSFATGVVRIIEHARPDQLVPLARSSAGSYRGTTAALGGRAATAGFGVKPRENEEGRSGEAAPRSGAESPAGLSAS